MNDTQTLPDLMPSATPSDADIATWQALPRDEQMRRMRLAMTHPDCSTISTATMSDIRTRGRTVVSGSNVKSESWGQTRRV